MVKQIQILKRRKIKGSFTVEAACVMPVILLVLFGLLYLCFFVHNRAWLTAAAYESALTGSMEGVKDNGAIYETASMRSQELGNAGFFGAENLSTQTSTGKRVRVTYSMETISVFGGFDWHLTAEGSSLVVRPVKTIRTVKAASDVISEIRGD